jgi:uncharacterized protein (TIGR02118 family)
MIRITVSYPNKDDAHFNHAYYQNQHAALVRQELDPRGMVRFEIDEILSDETGKNKSIIAAAHMFFEDIITFQAAMSAAGPALEADGPNYTNVIPTLLISRSISA